MKTIEFLIEIKTSVTLIFKNKEGDEKELLTTFKEMIDKSIDDYHDDLEGDCTNSGCNNESQNFCDCAAEFDDYELCNLKLEVIEQK